MWFAVTAKQGPSEKFGIVSKKVANKVSVLMNEQCLSKNPRK